jgi:hypothetical protein
MPQPALPETLRRLRDSSIRVAVVDVTPRDVALGLFRVVRAVGTRLQPLHCGYAIERRASPRLQQRLCGPMNPEPHPFS